MLSIGLIGQGHGSPAYYLDQVASGREDYYAGGGEAPGTWAGQGAQAEGRAGEVDGGQFADMLTPPAKSNQRLGGLDLTFSAPKSVSVLYGIGDIELSGKVRAAHDAAVTEALGYLERHATWTRRGKNGKQLLRGAGLTAALFRHRSSRAGDPQLHTHAVVANRTMAEGRATTLDSRAIHAHAKTAGFLYQAALRRRLTETVGVAWEPVTKGAAEISGIDPAVLEHFSQRSQEIAEHLADHGGRSRRAHELAALDSRKRKDHHVPTDRLHQEWRARAAEHGLGRAELDALLDRRASGPARQPDLQATSEHLASAHGLTEQRSSFDRRDVLQAWAEAHREGATVERLEQLADRWLAGDRAIPLERRTARRNVGGPRHSTPELLQIERELVRDAVQRVATGTAAVSAEDLSRAFLSDEQQDAARALTESGDGVQVLRAPAGSGKTRLLEVAKSTWEADGHRVFGAALSARAAFELEAQTGIDASTVARLRMDLDRGHALQRDDVLIVDEAGMVGTRDLAVLSRHTSEVGAKLVLVGDDHQLPEIDAGGGFRALADALPTVDLTKVHRQRHEWDREALAALRSGDVGTWETAYRQAGRIVSQPTGTQARDALIADWWRAAREDARDAVMVAHRRRDVADLNARARQLMEAEGRLGHDALQTSDRTFAPGDRVLLRRNDRRLGAINGARAVVREVDLEHHSLTVAVDRMGTLHLDAAYLDAGHLDHGYAMTAHAAQGLTVDQAFVLGTDDLYREWGYTALSRHRDESRFYAVSTGSAERCLPGLEPEDDDALTRTVTSALSTSRQQLTASSLAAAADVAIDDEDLRRRLADPPTVLTDRIGSRPPSVLERDEWCAAAIRVLRSPEPVRERESTRDDELQLDLGH